MALFKVKDLMIDVTSVQQAQICVNFTRICYFQCTFQITCNFFHSQICRFGCTVFNTPIPCVAGTTITFTPTCPGSVDPPFQVDPATLKEQLQAQLAAVEAAEKAVNDQLQPQTVADVDMLTQKLTEAMEALKARKAELQKGK